MIRMLITVILSIFLNSRNLSQAKNPQYWTICYQNEEKTLRLSSSHLFSAQLTFCLTFFARLNISQSLCLNDSKTYFVVYFGYCLILLNYCRYCYYCCILLLPYIACSFFEKILSSVQLDLLYNIYLYIKITIQLYIMYILYNV